MDRNCYLDIQRFPTKFLVFISIQLINALSFYQTIRGKCHSKVPFKKLELEWVAWTLRVCVSGHSKFLNRWNKKVSLSSSSKLRTWIKRSEGKDNLLTVVWRFWTLWVWGAACATATKVARANVLTKFEIIILKIINYVLISLVYSLFIRNHHSKSQLLLWIS